MALTDKAGYRIAGFKFTDADFDKNANVKILKFATRTLYKTVSLINTVVTNAASVTTFHGVFGGRLLTDGDGLQKIMFSMPKPPEYVSGNVVAKILWNSASNTGDLKLNLDTKSAVEGDDTSSGATDTATQTVDGTANDLNVMSITIAAADFNVGETIGFMLSRDPADGADTIAADVRVFAISFEYTGRG